MAASKYLIRRSQDYILCYVINTDNCTALVTVSQVKLDLQHYHLPYSEQRLQHKIVVCHLSLSFLDFLLLIYTAVEITYAGKLATEGKKDSVITDQNTASSERFLRYLTWCSILPQLLVEAFIPPLGQEKTYYPGITKDFFFLCAGEQLYISSETYFYSSIKIAFFH